MQSRKEFIIQFVGLSLGEHKYQFKITDKFFEDLGFSEMKQGDINVDLNLIKQSSMMIFHFKIDGIVKTECDRCLGELDLPITGTYKLVVKVGGHETDDEDDDIINVAANEHQLDLTQFIYEYIALSMPAKRIHPESKTGKSECDIEMLKKLDDFITENEPEGGDEPIDPRWEGLKGIDLN